MEPQPRQPHRLDNVEAARRELAAALMDARHAGARVAKSLALVENGFADLSDALAAMRD
jgi:hypothetical protein